MKKNIVALGVAVVVCNAISVVVAAKVPRYRYRVEDDRVDPCGGPIVPVIRIGPQEQTVPLWWANAMGYDRSHGRDWPCRGRKR